LRLLEVHILVVDDFEPWRRTVFSLLQARPEWKVICEASDGLEAVQKAEELQPDLILLDIGLPKLNGIEAARRIRKLVPKSDIIFLSQESSADIVREALSLGARGYVVKAHAGSELEAAVEAVMQGNQFISSGLTAHDFTDAGDAQAPGCLRRNKVLASVAASVPRETATNCCHEVQFYSDDAFLLDSFTHFIGAALKAGTAAIVVATQSHRDSLRQRLQAHGLDMDAAIERGRYISLDAAATLSTITVDGWPDPDRFLERLGSLVVAAAGAAEGEDPRVAACGECAPLLWAEGKADAAIRIEQLCNELGKRYDVDILCGYPLSGFHREEDIHVLQSICAEHSAVHSR